MAARCPGVRMAGLPWVGAGAAVACLAAAAGAAFLFRRGDSAAAPPGEADRLVAAAHLLGHEGPDGIGVAQGRLVALLNNDAVAEPGWLAALVAALQAHPLAAACDSKVFFYDQRDRLWAAGGDYTVSGAVLHRGYRLREAEAGLHGPAEVFIAIACAALYRREALEAMGGLDEMFFSGYEDVDLSFRLHAAGYSVLNVPDAIVYHRVSETHGLDSPQYVYHGQKNVLLTFLKNMPTPLLIRYAPLHLIYTLGALAYFARRGRLGAALRGKAFVLRHWGQVLARRRETQRRRTVPAGQLAALFSRAWFGPKLDKLLR